MTNLAWQKDDVDDGGKVYYVSSYSEPFTRSDFIEAPAVPSGRGFGFYASISFKSEGTRTNRRWPYFTYSNRPDFMAAQRLDRPILVACTASGIEQVNFSRKGILYGGAQFCIRVDINHGALDHKGQTEKNLYLLNRYTKNLTRLNGQKGISAAT